MPRKYGSVSIAQRIHENQHKQAVLAKWKRDNRRLQDLIRFEQRKFGLMAETRNRRPLRRKNPDAWTTIPMPIQPPEEKMVCPTGTAISLWIKMSEEEQRAHIKKVGKYGTGFPY